MTKRQNQRIRRERNKTARHSSGFNSDELFLQPWFLPKRNQLSMIRLMPPDYRNKFSAYFEDYGCLICGTYEQYFANGMCLRCNQMVRARLLKSVKRRVSGKPDPRIDLVILKQGNLARKLLASFAARIEALPQPPPTASIPKMNPVDEFLAPQPT